MRKITYICHSGFLVELDHIQLLFDYYKGSLECVNKDKPLYVFASHRHPDHFVEKIFELAETYQEVHYILSNDIWKKRVPENLREQTVFLGPHRKETIGDVTVETLKSTDEGVAFLVETEGQTIYHAGDLNDWTWPGEPEAENRVMRERYRKEIDRLAGRKIDLAFVVLESILNKTKSTCSFVNLANWAFTTFAGFSSRFTRIISADEVITSTINPNISPTLSSCG